MQKEKPLKSTSHSTLHWIFSRFIQTLFAFPSINKNTTYDQKLETPIFALFTVFLSKKEDEWFLPCIFSLEHLLCRNLLLSAFFSFINCAIPLEQPQESEQQRMIKKPSLNGAAHCGHYCAQYCSLKLKNSEKLCVTVSWWIRFAAHSILIARQPFFISIWLHPFCVCGARSRDSFIRNRNTTIFGVLVVP